MERELETRQETVELDLQDILGVLNKWKIMIVIITLVAILVAGILSFFILPPIYEAQTTLLVVQGEDKKTVSASTDDLESLISDISQLPAMTIKTYVEQVKNPVLLGEVVKKLELETLNYTYSTLEKMVEATSIQDTNLIKVTVQNTDPRLALSIGETLTEEFLDSISKNNQMQMSKSVQLLEEQAALVSTQLEEQRALLREFESRPNSVAYMQQQQEGYMQELTTYRSSYNETKIACRQLETGINELESQLAATSKTLEEGQLNPLYQSLTEKLSTKKLELAERKSQLATTSEYILNLEKKLDSLQIQLTDKRAEADLLYDRVEELEKTNQLLTEKITQTQISQSVSLGDTSLLIISPATVSSDPVKPNKKLNIAIAAVLGLMLAVALSFVLEMLDNRINTRKDVEKYLQLSVLGEIPIFSESNGHLSRQNKNGKKKGKKKLLRVPLITYENSKSPEAEAIKVLRTNLQFVGVDKPMKTILFTSTGPDEGKSLVLANLAVALGQTEKRVLVIDCDLRLPVQHKIFNISNLHGVTNTFAEEGSYRQHVQKTQTEGVDLLAAGPIPPNPSELLGSERFTKLLDELKEEYDYILVDAPPVLAVTDASLLSTKADGVITVVLSGQTQINRAKEAKEQLVRSKAHLVGVILNGVERSKGENYYYYYYRGDE